MAAAPEPTRTTARLVFVKAGGGMDGVAVLVTVLAGVAELEQDPAPVNTGAVPV